MTIQAFWKPPIYWFWLFMRLQPIFAQVISSWKLHLQLEKRPSINNLLQLFHKLQHALRVHKTINLSINCMKCFVQPVLDLRIFGARPPGCFGALCEGAVQRVWHLCQHIIYKNIDYSPNLEYDSVFQAYQCWEERKQTHLQFGYLCVKCQLTLWNSNTFHIIPGWRLMNDMVLKISTTV